MGEAREMSGLSAGVGSKGSRGYPSDFSVPISKPLLNQANKITDIIKG